MPSQDEVKLALPGRQETPCSLEHHSSAQGQGQLAFTKMQGLGNDFVVVTEEDLLCAVPAWANKPAAEQELSELARLVCDRHFGVGADGLIVVRRLDGQACDLAWRYFNSDGSSSAMCGNGLRCAAHFAVHNRWAERQTIEILTENGPLAVEYQDADRITVDLGPPVLTPKEIPVVSRSGDLVLREPIVLDGKSFAMTCVNVGNPHCVIFDPPIEPADYGQYAPRIQSLDLFPQGVNVEFASCPTRDEASVYVWERGSGPTLACASGAAAVLVAGCLEGRLEQRAIIALPGGRLEARWQEDSSVKITGPARVSFTGTIAIDVQYRKGCP